MAEITLGKALKIKNRLAGRLAKVQADIQAFNSVPEGQAGQVNGYNEGRKSPPDEGRAMPRKKLSRNAPCPCGSGKKYKACCWDKGFEWVEDEAGTIVDPENWTTS